MNLYECVFGLATLGAVLVIARFLFLLICDDRQAPKEDVEDECCDNDDFAEEAATEPWNPCMVTYRDETLSILGASGFTTIRACIDCGVLQTGGPTRCLACARHMEKEA